MAHMILQCHIFQTFRFPKAQPEKILILLKSHMSEMPVRPVELLSLFLLHRPVEEPVLHSDL